jgi:hypothetical protein
LTGAAALACAARQSPVRNDETNMRALPAIAIALLAVGCASTETLVEPRGNPVAITSRIVVVRTSHVGGGAGSWVPMRVELDGKIIGSLPDHSYLSLPMPPGEFDLSVTPMIDLRYPPASRMTLRESVAAGEVAHFLIVTVFGADCPTIYAAEGVGRVTSTQQHPRPDWVQTACLTRVPSEMALSELPELRKAP